jgi:hypothetical protein
MSLRLGRLLPLKRPWWLLVLLAMIGFGYIQEDAKIKLNHYMKVGDRYSDFYDYGHVECNWEASCMLEKRKEWWDGYAPFCRTSISYSRDTFEVFHRLGRVEMARAKWGLMVAIVLGFFVLDAMFLRAAGVGERWKLLMLIYGASGLVTAVFWALDGQAGQNEAGYNVAREVLGFLQSPLPSLMLVLLPWLRNRALEGQLSTKKASLDEV